MKPIRNKRELERAKKALHDLRLELALLRQTYRHDKDACELATHGLRELCRETARAIAAYEQAKSGKLPAVVGARNARTGALEIPRVLRLLRQAAQLGQAELAEKLGTAQANISRWERSGYDRYELRQLQRIADALGCDLEVSFLRRKERRKQKATGGRNA